MTKARWSPKERPGGAAVELVVVFPFILLLLIGVVDYGRAFYTSVTVANAARAGADFGQRDGALTAFNTPGIVAAAQADGNEAGTLTLSTSRVCECGGAARACSTFCSGGAAPEVYVVVTASKTLNTYFPYPGLPSSITISRTATFRSQ